MRDDAAREDTRRRLAKREKQFGKKSSQQSDPTRDSPQTVAPPRHDDARAMSRSTDTLSVIQYNVLADALSGPDAGFTSMPPCDLAFGARRAKLLGKIIAEDADVVCLQEVDHYHDAFKPAMDAAGYDGIYREDEWSPCRKLSGGMLRDGVAIFYKREKLQLCGMDLPGVPRRSKDGDGDKSTFNIDAGKCIVARFRVLPPREETHGPRWEEYQCSMREVVVATVHLDSKKDEEGAKKRRNQAFHMMKAVEKMTRNSPTKPVIVAGDFNYLLPVIVAGDFNAVPSEPAVDLVKNGIDGGLRSAYEYMNGTDPAFTTWKIRSGNYKKGEAKMCIDYIFVPRECGILSVGALPDENDIGPKGLPCEKHPSDHLMLRADLKIRVQ